MRNSLLDAKLHQIATELSVSRRTVSAVYAILGDVEAARRVCEMHCRYIDACEVARSLNRLLSLRSKRSLFSESGGRAADISAIVCDSENRQNTITDDSGKFPPN